MTEEEKTVNRMVIKELDKLIDKQIKKAEKSRIKKNDAHVTYKGEVYKSTKELMEAYACDVFTSSVYDRLSERLEKAKDGTDDYPTTEETILILLRNYRGNLDYEIRKAEADEAEKEKREKRFQEFMDQGMSYREAETALENELLMNQLD